jgi:hypothetical protein
MTLTAKTVRLFGTIGAWGAAIVASLVTFLFIGIVVIGAGSMSLGTVTVLLIVTVVAGKLTYNATLRWVGRREVLVREQEQLAAEMHEREVSTQAETERLRAEAANRKAAWDADAPRRQAESEADAPRRERAAEEKKARETQIRTEIETRIRVNRGVAEAENAHRAAVEQAEYARRLAAYNQQAAANNQLAKNNEKLWVAHLASLRDAASRATWLPTDLHETLKLRAKTTPWDRASIGDLQLTIERLAPLETVLRKSSKNTPQYDLAIAEARRILA